MSDVTVIDLDTAKRLTPSTQGRDTTVALDVPITKDRQSAHLRVAGTSRQGYQIRNGELTLDRELRGLRNTVVLPAGYEVSAVSQSATIGRTRDGRAFVALVNLNAENAYRVTIRARSVQ